MARIDERRTRFVRIVAVVLVIGLAIGFVAVLASSTASPP
jgi:hypothetical protein